MWWILMIPFLASAALGTAYALTDTRTSARSAAIAVMLTGMIFGGSYWSYTLSHGMSQRGAVSGYQQYINTSAESTAVSTTTCSRDGSCRHTYKCDSYDRWEKIGTKTEYYTSKGERNNQKDHRF